MGESVTVDDSFTLGDFFEKQCPFYLSIGLTYEEYWNGLPKLAQYSLSAYNLKRERELEEMNFQCWLQGAYIQDAVTVGVAYALNGKEAKNADIHYHEKPMDIFEKENDEKETDSHEVQKAQNDSVEWLMALYKQTNAHFGTDV